MTKFIPYFLLIASVVLPQTKIIKIIDPGGTGDYKSLMDWANDRAGDITAKGRNTIEIAECICTNGQPDSASDIGSLFITDSIHYIEIIADSLYRHKGIYPLEKSNIYRIESTPSNSSLLQVNTSKVIIDGICFKDSLGQGNCITLIDCNDGGYVSNCILERIKTSADEHGNGIRVDAETKYSKYFIRNNIIYGFNNVNAETPGNIGILTYPIGDSMMVFIDNNTIYNSKFGIWNRGGEIGYYSSLATVRNNLVQNPYPLSNSSDFFNQSQYADISSNNVSLPASTPINAVSIPNNSFENGTVFPFISDTSELSLAGYPINSGHSCLSINKGTSSVNINTISISGMKKFTDYTFSFYNAYGGGSLDTIYLTNNRGLKLGGSSVTTTSYNFVSQSIKFYSDTNTSFIIHIINNSSNWGKCYIDNLQMFMGDSVFGNKYFENPAKGNFHLMATGILAVGKGINLSADKEDPFNNDIDYGIRSNIWDVGADQYNSGNVVDSTTVNLPYSPVLISPNSNTKIPDSTSSILFYWKESLFAISYRFQIAYDKEFKNIIEDSTDIADTAINYSLVRLHSTFYWRVQGNNLLGAGSWSEPMVVYLLTVIFENNNEKHFAYKLDQNYPNPFNPSTTIKYQIAKPGLVQLKVYDILGREIATLVNEFQAAGEHSVLFSLTNNQQATNHERLSSGVYLYQLRAGGFVEAKKLILLK